MARYACPIDACDWIADFDESLTTPHVEKAAIDVVLELHLDEAHPDISLAEIKQRIARTQAP